MVNDRFDLFLSYADTDEAWVQDWLVPRLASAGLRIHTPMNFDLGVPRLVNIERAVGDSRRILLVLTPAWVASEWAEFEGLLGQATDPVGRQQQVLPLLLQPCIPPPRLALLTAADFTMTDRREVQLQRVITAVRDEQRLREVGPLLCQLLAVADLTFAALPLDTLPDIAPLPPGSRMPFPPNRLFVGRADDLKALAQALKAGGSAVGQVAAATGMGGIGKTQLATEFAHRYGPFFAGGVFWVSCESAQGLPAEVAACGGTGALELRPDFGTLKLDEQIALVRAAWQSALPRLVIFDNCEDEALLKTWRPPTGGCRVLITSRRGQWSATLGVTMLPLGVLRRAESVALLRKHRPDLATDDPNLDALVAELGDLPLALHLAGSFLETYRDEVRFGAPANFLAELRSTRLMEHPALAGEDVTPSPTNHVLHVGRTFALSYERLDAADPRDAQALTLLARAAHFAPGEPIPRELLLQTLEVTEEDRIAARQAAKALNRLTDLGLLERVSADQVRLHRLLAAFVRSSATDDAALPVVEQVLLNRAFDLDVEPLPAALPSLRTHLRHVTDAAMHRADERAAHLCNRLGRLLVAQGDLAGAQGYFKQALAIAETRLGAENRWTQLFRRDVATFDTALLGQEQVNAELLRAAEIDVAAALTSGSAEERAALGAWLEETAQQVETGEEDDSAYRALAAQLRSLAAQLTV